MENKTIILITIVIVGLLSLVGLSMFSSYQRGIWNDTKVMECIDKGFQPYECKCAVYNICR